MNKEETSLISRNTQLQSLQWREREVAVVRRPQPRQDQRRQRGERPLGLLSLLSGHRGGPALAPEPDLWKRNTCQTVSGTQLAGRKTKTEKIGHSFTRVQEMTFPTIQRNVSNSSMLPTASRARTSDQLTARARSSGTSIPAHAWPDGAQSATFPPGAKARIGEEVLRTRLLRRRRHISRWKMVT